MQAGAEVAAYEGDFDKMNLVNVRQKKAVIVGNDCMMHISSLKPPLLLQRSDNPRRRPSLYTFQVRQYFQYLCSFSTISEKGTPYKDSVTKGY